MAVIAAAAALGVGLWWWLARESDDGRLAKVCTVALAAGLACRVVFALFTPTFYAPDERAHFNYVKHLAEERSFPTARHKVGHPANDYESFQAPLYYLGAVPVYAVASALEPDSEAFALRLVRLWSVAMWVGLVAVTLRVLDALDVRHAAVRTVTILAAALWPTHVVVTSSVTNTNLLMLFGALLMLMALRIRALGPRQSVSLGIVCGLALLTKLFALVVLVAVALLLLARRQELGASTRRWLGSTLLIGAVAGALWAPWLIRDLHVYGRFNGGAVDVLKPNPLSAIGSLAFGVQEFLWTFWATAGRQNDIYLGGTSGRYLNVGLTLAGLAVGTLVAIWLRNHPPPWFDRRLRQFLWPTAVGLALNVVGMAWLTGRYGVGLFQGRYFYTLFVPLALIGAVVVCTAAEVAGVSGIGVHVGGFCLLYVITFTAYAMVTFPRP